MSINNILNENKNAVSLLLRRYRVPGDPTIETINNAHRTHGAPFMTKLMAILTPTAGFTNFADMLNPGGFIDTSVRSQQPKTTGKFWGFVDKLLSTTERAGQTIGQFKVDAAGNAIYTDVDTQRQQQNQKTVLIIAAVLVVAIVAILIFKKK